MPLDDRIRQLSETIIQEVRGPIESALHNLLSEVMKVAAEDRDHAVRSAVAAAATEHQASLAALREQAERDRTDVAALREQTEHDRTSGEALREAREREHDEKLVALRSELTGEHEATVAGVRDTLTREHETGTAALREQLAREHDAALTSLREHLDQARESAVSDLRAALDQEHDATVARLRDELAREHEATTQAIRDEAARDHHAQVQDHEARAVAERESAVQAVRDELGRSHESALNATRTAAELVGGATLAAALTHAEHEKHEAETRVAALEQELGQTRTEASRAQQAMHEADQARHEADQARQDAQHATKDAQHARQDAEQKQLAAEQNLVLTLAADREQELACSDRTVAAFRRLDAARSLTEILRILADQAATEIGRVAVLLVIDERLRGWELRGLPGADAAAIDVPVDPGNVFGLAIARGLPVSTSDAPLGLDGDSLAALLAAPPDRAGLAVPVSVGGRVVAILYADDVGDRRPAVPSNWPEIAEILARHAGHCLEVLTISHASILAGRVQHDQVTPATRRSDASPFADQRREEESARRYARLLISEIKLYNETAVEQGREERNLLGRLGPAIERARRLYEEKIPAAVRQRVDCFDQEVVSTLAGGDPGLLGQT